MDNRGVTVHLGNEKSFDLYDILKIVGNRGKQAVWQISNAECFGSFAELIHLLSDNDQRVSGHDLYEILERNNGQTIEGEFEAFDTTTGTEWLLIRFVRGDEVDIQTQDSELLGKIRSAFGNISDFVD